MRACADKELDVTVYEEGDSMPPHLVFAVRRLFQESYRWYPYIDEVGAVGRVRVVVFTERRAAGYAAFKVVGRFAICGNLLVAAAVRGLGIGRQLDRMRLNLIRRRGLRMYVSCLCEDLASQRLKADLGLAAVNVKYGHQVRSLVADGKVGSSIVFADPPFAVEPALATRTDVDRRLQRVRTVARTAEDWLPVREHCGRDYSDVLVGAEEAAVLRRDPSFAYAGVELDMLAGRWHHCFQLRNGVYREGVAQEPALLVSAEDMAHRHLVEAGRP